MYQKEKKRKTVSCNPREEEGEGEDIKDIDACTQNARAGSYVCVLGGQDDTVSAEFFNRARSILVT